MATFQFLEQEALQTIAPKLSPWMIDYQASQSCTIAESLEVCTISALDLRNTQKTAQDCLVSASDYWHLQVKMKDIPACCMRISLDDKGDWAVDARYDHQMAQQIDNALSWIDANIRDSCTIRMFQIPSYYITGLTLEHDENLSVYIILKAPGIPVETDCIYPFEKMRSILVRTEPVLGVEINTQE